MDRIAWPIHQVGVRMRIIIIININNNGTRPRFGTVRGTLAPRQYHVRKFFSTTAPCYCAAFIMPRVLHFGAFHRTWMWARA